MQSLVLACGVRKVWSKLFKDLDSRQQISKLKAMLADLGMTGRLSLEKAKEIRAKREFQQELGACFVSLHPQLPLQRLNEHYRGRKRVR